MHFIIVHYRQSLSETLKTTAGYVSSTVCHEHVHTQACKPAQVCKHTYAQHASAGKQAQARTEVWCVHKPAQVEKKCKNAMFLPFTQGQGHRFKHTFWIQ